MPYWTTTPPSAPVTTDNPTGQVQGSPYSFTIDDWATQGKTARLKLVHAYTKLDEDGNAEARFSPTAEDPGATEVQEHSGSAKIELKINISKKKLTQVSTEN